ncbi:uncharacterized protein LOC141690521 [Apium graveolens]|uniref:uncharacterized protein LOC141690521 n=1 Tax=Apium graveolens TaxID=4045 RepID=UPI003D7BD332
MAGSDLSDCIGSVLELVALGMAGDKDNRTSISYGNCGLSADAPEHYVIKEKLKWLDAEKVAMLKDAKVRNIMHNSLDNVMSNRVISCKTAKEIWDALKTQCMMAIKKNRRVVLVQEYEQFDAKVDESITDTYDRFLTLLNDLSLVEKEFEREYSNTKFLRALP